MDRMPSSKDWSEFNVWCFAPNDVEKLERHHLFITGHIDQPEVTSGGVVTGSIRPDNNSFTRRLLDGRIRIDQTKQGSSGGVSGGGGGGSVSSQTTLVSASSVAHQTPIKYVYAQFAAGAIGGGTATYSTHWLDTIKVKMQMYPGVYSSGTSCLRETLKNEGLRGLYLGATPALVGQMTKTSIVFLAYGICEETIASMAGFQSTEELSTMHHASAGAMAAVGSSFVLCPLELIKCRLQALQCTTGASQITTRISPFGVARDVVKADGFKGLYRGLTGIWTKEVPGSFIYFGSYEAAKHFIRGTTEVQLVATKLDILEIFGCGMFAGLCYCVTHPIETVKTRVQVQKDNKFSQSGFIRTFAQIARTEGITPLCSGLKPSLLRASIFSGVQFVTYELARNYILSH